MNPITLTTVAEPLIRAALAEDITNEDVSTAAIMPEAHPAAVDLIAKADGVLCGHSPFSIPKAKSNDIQKKVAISSQVKS